MPRSRCRGGRRAHNKRIRQNRLKSHQDLMDAGRKVITKLLGDVTPQHPELVPFVADPVTNV